ncbi:MAG: hypothetical protein MUF31_18115 [Akkermansiaceae bacterium]|jgi:hypothetical protein|nr:hypothetical protein [Akkermansiaceae bacterium]
MIAYTFPSKSAGDSFHDKLLAEIAAEDGRKRRKKSWPDRSAEALAKFLADPSKEIPSLWSEIKPVFTRLQHGKCAFCERPLGADEVSAYEQDMEHFRPKKGLTPWPPKQPLGSLPHPSDIPTSLHSGQGYRHLPFHELNYIVACKTCNSRCKANYFPIAGTKHDFTSKDPVPLLTKEKPYLVYPLGGLDDDPESIITFIGYRADVPKSAKGHKRDRARVIIHFFLLNDPTRSDQLFFGRATQLDLLRGKILDFEKSPAAQRQSAWDQVILECSSVNPFAGCVRSMVRLYRSDPDAAHALLKEASEYRRSMLGAANIKEISSTPPLRRR